METIFVKRHYVTRKLLLLDSHFLLWRIVGLIILKTWLTNLNKF